MWGFILVEAGFAKQEQPERDEVNCISPEKFAFRIMHKNYASLADVDKYLIFFLSRTSPILIPF